MIEHSNGRSTKVLYTLISLLVVGLTTTTTIIINGFTDIAKVKSLEETNVFQQKYIEANSGRIKALEERSIERSSRIDVIESVLKSTNELVTGVIKEDLKSIKMDIRSIEMNLTNLREAVAELRAIKNNGH